MLFFWFYEPLDGGLTVEMSDSGGELFSGLRMLLYPLQVRTTAPEKYRVKPSSSCCESGASVDIVVSLHGGTTYPVTLPTAVQYFRNTVWKFL